jgi:ATP-dependent DNA ligase
VRKTDRPPKWIKPQLTRLVEEAPSGESWIHEVNYDGYRMHATEDNLLRQVSYQAQREDKPARQVVRLIPHPPRTR